MKTSFLAACLLTPLLLGAAPPVSRAAGDGFDAAAAADAFGLELYLRNRVAGENLFFSPASVAYALSMARLGAAGGTAGEMDRVLHLPGDPETIAAGFGDLMTALTGGEGGATLQLANRLYGQSGLAFRPDFLARIERHYGAGFEQAPFRADPDGARRAINAWVAERTAQKIPDLLSAGAVTPQTALVLVNAIHFLGEWATPFPASATRDASFQRERGGDVDVPFMHVTGRFGYAEHAGLQVLAMPYVGGELEMVIVLPAADTPLASLETDLDAGTLAGWLQATTSENVRVALPRLHLETSFDLAEVLKAMGMPTAFSGAADFSGMTRQEQLFISAVVHKAYLDVDEKGTEAAAATAVVMERTSAVEMGPTKSFTADRPFLLAIRHPASGAVLFLGRVADPS